MAITHGTVPSDEEVKPVIPSTQLVEVISSFAGKKLSGILMGGGGGGGGGGGAGTVTEVDTGTGLVGGPITSIGTISLSNTSVFPGTYNNSTITVDQQGRLTFAGSGSSGTPGGTPGQIQYDNAGAFGGFTMSGDGTLNTSTGVLTISSGAITLAKMANEAANTLLGNNTGSPAAPAALTATQITAFLNVFSSSLKGVVPASGGGTTNFLRADGTWVSPGGAGSPGGSSGQIQYNNSGSFGGLTPTQVTALLNQFSSSLQGVVPASGGGSSNFLRADGAWAAPGGGGGGSDPLSLVNGFTLTATDPTPSGTTAFSYGGFFNVTYDKLLDDIGFTDQIGLAVNLEFNAGYNQYGGTDNVNAKYTPIALEVSSTFYGAGEKFCQTWGANMYSMGDCFLWSGALTYAGGPIQGDEGQGFTPATYCNQPNSLVVDVITAVHRTTYSSTVTGAVAALPNVQAIPVASTVGATVGDWVILHQEVMDSGTRIWAMQITAINPGVSISGVCAINLIIGDTVTPALCLSLANAGLGFGEGRVVINNSGASHSTGTVSPSGGSFIGTGTGWTNTMVGGDALNVGSVWLTVDNLESAPFSSGVGNNCRSVYQIIRVNATTAIDIFSFSVAGDIAYHGKGEGLTGLAYTIVPSARVMRTQNPGGGFDVICEHSAHTWTVGDNIECVFCPYPDLHGFDYRIGTWTAGGTLRSGMSIVNNGARMMGGAIGIGASGGIVGAQAGYDVFAWGVGLQITYSQVGIQIQSLPNTGGSDAIQIQANSDTGTVIRFTGPNSIATIGTNGANQGTDFQLCNTRGLLSAIDANVNIDTFSTQLVWDGYFQVANVHGFDPYIRFGGLNTAGATINGTFDLKWTSGDIRFLMNVGSAQPNIPVEIVSDGTFKLGSCNLGGSGDHRVTLDAVTNLTAARTVTFPNTSGDILIAAANTTGAGTPLFGTNSPAITNTHPYTWLKMISNDGSTVYVPAWK